MFASLALSAQIQAPLVAPHRGISLADPLTVSWEFKSEETVNLTPATDGMQLYIPTAAGGLLTLLVQDGKLAWKESVGGEISADPAADESAVFIANEIGSGRPNDTTAKGAVRALSRDSGVTLWMRTLPFPLRGGLAADSTTLYGGSVDGRVYAFNKVTGQAVWVKQLGGPLNSHPAVYENQLYLGCDDGTLYALDRRTGNVLWRYRTRGAVRGRPSATGDQLSFGSADGYVYTLQQNSGKKQWSVRTGAAVQSVTIVDGHVIAASLDNFAYGFTLARGNRLWKRQLEGRPLAEPVTNGRSVLFSPIAGSGGIVLDSRDGKVLNSLPTGQDNNSAASPVITKGIVLLTTRQGLLAFSHPGP